MTETEEEIDIRDYSERPANDLRPPKSPRKKQGNTSKPNSTSRLPQLCGNAPCNHGNLKTNPPRDKRILSVRRKVPRGWPACQKRSTPKAAFQNNDIYLKSTESSENLYEEPQEKGVTELPKEKNIREFYKLKVKEKEDLTSTPQEEEYDDRNYKSIEE